MIDYVLELQERLRTVICRHQQQIHIGGEVGSWVVADPTYLAARASHKLAYLGLELPF